LVVGGDAIGDVCGACVRSVGAVMMPQPRRPPSPCARCGSRRFVRSIPVVPMLIGDGKIVVAPRAVTYAISNRGQRVGLMMIDDYRLDPRQPLGIIARYVCVRCGAVEDYCEDPERIPIDAEHMTDVVDYGDDVAPYR
jgi:DNA-directed RNA polymerase subunit RPC12/RpoP